MNERKFHKQLVETLDNSKMCPINESREGQRQGQRQGHSNLDLRKVMVKWGK